MPKNSARRLAAAAEGSNRSLLPVLMNDLPKVLRDSGSRNTFIKHLKIFSFHRNFVKARRVCDNRLTRRLYELNYLFYSLKLTGPRAYSKGAMDDKHKNVFVVGTYYND